MPIARVWNGPDIDEEEGILSQAARRSGLSRRLNLRVLDYVSVQVGEVLL
jgi:hypothetical protein